MCINNTSEQIHIDIKIEARETGEQWKSSFDANYIETMTTKTGNFKSFNVFIDMLENAINQKSSSVSLDLLTCDDLDLLRKKQENHKKKSSTKRYLMLIYNAEYDRIYYPLSLRYCDKSDQNSLIEQMHQLIIENQLLKNQFESDSQNFNEHEKCLRLKKEKDQQIDFLRQMIRTNEDTLIKERIHLQKTKTKKNNRNKIFNDQIDLLKTSERQLKSQVKVLTNEIDLLKKTCSPYGSQQQIRSLSRLRSDDQRQCRSASVTKRLPSAYNSDGRFNPTAYIHERNLKIRQTEWQKKKETRRRLSTGRYHSDSDISDITPNCNNNNKSYSQKRTETIDQHKFNDSFDSDIERVSWPLVLHKAASNNSTILYSPEQSNFSINDDIHVTDIDQRIKSLQKFYKQTFTH
ncbi:unnamed protein product [Adineta steineri]|uniref:Uncharacterized protein n=1 Tax=Adineta steineri TaxID=433720 RepID=A0A814THF8_9BILA|nr:unnamed protein product [Adineta steineri]CAF1355851.1 unnamed protein product [Adineta steineri]